MEQIERIMHMEKMMDQSTAAVASLSQALEEYGACLEQLKELEAYYEGLEWRQDYEDDCAGRLPKDLKRGVLSQDGVYDLMEEWREVQKELQKLGAEQ